MLRGRRGDGEGEYIGRVRVWDGMGLEILFGLDVKDTLLAKPEVVGLGRVYHFVLGLRNNGHLCGYIGKEV